jgi:predicted O-methyltransferase YrrM
MHLPWRALQPGDGPAILTSLTEAETATLAELAAGKRVLEIGAAFGYSTVVLGRAATSLISVDPHHAHNSHEILLSNLAGYNLSVGIDQRVEVLRATSQHALPMLAEDGCSFDLIFIDGDHTAAGVEHDIKWALELLAEGGVIACHDVLETCCCPDVGPTVDLFLPTFDLIDSMAVVRTATA